MNAINKKLLRDLERMSGQAATIAAVMAIGIACFIALRGNYASLIRARDVYYENQRFAQIFAHLARAPESVTDQLEAIPEVARVETRVVEVGTIPLPDIAQPITAQLISLPSDGHPALNDVVVHGGRMPEAHATDEALVLKDFAEHHHVEPGDELDVVINGKRRGIRITGLAISPEFIVPFSPGDMAPAPGRFAVLWMRRDVLAATFQMEGAFNDVIFSLQPGASEPASLAAVDKVLERYGGAGAIGRAKQPSSFFVNGELLQLESMANVVPAIFLAVAALLINIVLSRMVHLQRPEIATLKAVGYSDWEVGGHFAKLIGMISSLGGLLGVALGVYLGDAMLGLYADFFKFPNLRFVMDLESAAMAVAISVGSAGLGAFMAIRQVVKLPPAEAMRPAAPARYRRSVVDLLGLGWLFGAGGQMIIRELERRPMRTAMSTLAIASSIGLMVVGGWYYDGIDDIMQVQFHEVMREDMVVVFAKPTPERAIGELGNLPGVVHAEGLRVLPVRFRNGHHYRDGSIMGYPDDIEMRALRNQLGETHPLPPDGLVLSDMLAELLHLKVGDAVEVKVNDGERGTMRLTVTGTIKESFGLQGHMRLDPLRVRLGEGELISMGLLRVDPAAGEEIDHRLKDLPGVLNVTRRRDILDRFHEQSGNMILTFALIITLFAATITIGVVYNNARVALSQRSRDLASLRVLGFRRTEISAILLSEMAIVVALAIPIGLVFGTVLVQWLAALADPETYRLSVIITPKSYAFATIVALGASAASALLVRRKLDHLDLIAVLKTRE